MISKRLGARFQRAGGGRRSARGLAGLMGVGALVVAATVACGSDGDSTSESSSSTVAVTEPAEDTEADATETDVTGSDAPTTMPSPTTTPVPTLVAMIDAEPVAVSDPFADVDAGDGRPVAVRWIVPWRDGFLAVGIVVPGLPSELPEEVAALFPQGVVDLFPDGLPPTIGEATAILQEAGLYETVEDIVAANPAAYDAIFPPPGSSEHVFTWSEDGDVWKLLEGSFPDSMAEVLMLAGAGDHLVVAGLSPTEDLFAAEARTVVSSTSDLIEWTSHDIAPQLPTKLPDGVELPDGVRPVAWPSDLVANETGWVFAQGVSLEFDFEELLPPDLAGRLITEDLMILVEDEGVRIQRSEADATDSEELLLTWEELGFDETLRPYLGFWAWGSPPVRTGLWAATWTGSPVLADTGQLTTAVESGELIATSDGFIWQSGGISYSADGLSWTDLPAPPLSGAAAVPDFALPLTDGVAVFDGAAGGITVYRIAVTGQEWEAIEVPGLPDQIRPGDYPQGSHWIVDASRDVAHPDQWLLVTVDGDRWLIDDLDDGDEENLRFYVAALNGDVVLVGTDAGNWMRYDLSGS